MGNKNLNLAKSAKNDEFYTRLEDIERELVNYDLTGKTIYCNCDDVSFSNFFKFFMDKVDEVRFKRVIFSGLNVKHLTIVDNVNGVLVMERRALHGNGDFRSEECVEVLKASDVVITNPPFSLFREYIAQLVDHDKEFLIIGSQNAITYKETFKLIKESKLWLGSTKPKEFRQPDNYMKVFGNIGWFTNLSHKKRNEDITLFRTYADNEHLYPKYDNYDAIEVSKVKDIPADYKGLIGVPITFLNKYNPEQFEIIDTIRPHVKSKAKFQRFIIKVKD